MLVLSVLAAIVVSGCTQPAPESTASSHVIPETNPLADNATAAEEPAAQPAAQPVHEAGLLEWTKEGKLFPGISSSTIRVGGEYRMYYTADGIKLATSGDGLHFTESGQVLGPEYPEMMISNPAVVALRTGGYRMFFEGRIGEDRRLYSAFSSDGLSWETEDGVRYEDFGDGKPGEIFVSVPDVIEINGSLYLYYTRGISLAAAISEDQGMTWTKLRNIELGNISVAMDPDMVKLGDGYKLFFTTADTPDLGDSKKFWILSASSSNGLDFRLDPGIRLEPDIGKKIVSDIDIIVLNDSSYRAYYSQASDFSFMDAELHSAVSFL